MNVKAQHTVLLCVNAPQAGAAHVCVCDSNQLKLLLLKIAR